MQGKYSQQCSGSTSNRGFFEYRLLRPATFVRSGIKADDLKESFFPPEL